MARPVKSEGNIITIWDATALTSGASATSSGVDVSSDGYFGLWVQASPSSACSAVRILFEQSYDNTTTHYVVPATATDIITALTDGNPHIYSIAPTPMTYIRLKAACGSTDQSDLKITAILFHQ